MKHIKLFESDKEDIMKYTKDLNRKALIMKEIDIIEDIFFEFTEKSQNCYINYQDHYCVVSIDDQITWDEMYNHCENMTRYNEIVSEIEKSLSTAKSLKPALRRLTKAGYKWRFSRPSNHGHYSYEVEINYINREPYR